MTPVGFPHSDITGSKVARHLPDAYRRHATSFIASKSQGIHHAPLITAFYSPSIVPRSRESRADLTLTFLQAQTNADKFPRQSAIQ